MYNPKGTKVRFCPNGHDTFLVGRKGSTCSVCKHNLGKTYRKKDHLKRRDHQWRYRGIKCTEELYNIMLHQQNNRCAICLKDQILFT